MMRSQPFHKSCLKPFCIPLLCSQMDGNLIDFEDKKKFLKRVHQQKNPDTKIIEKLFKEVSENICKQTWD